MYWLWRESSHKKSVICIVFLPSAGHPPVFTLDHLHLLYWDVSLLCPGITPLTKVIHVGNALPLQPGLNSVLEQQVPSCASWEQFMQFWANLKQTGKQFHNANFEITFHSTSNFNLHLFTHPFLLLSLKKTCGISVSFVEAYCKLQVILIHLFFHIQLKCNYFNVPWLLTCPCCW